MSIRKRLEGDFWSVDYLGTALVGASIFFLGSTAFMESRISSPLPPVIAESQIRSAYLEGIGWESPEPNTPEEVYRRNAVASFITDARQAAVESHENLCEHYLDATRIIAPFKQVDVDCG